VESQNSEDVFARFPAGLVQIVTHPKGTTWGGSVSQQIYLMTLEGESAEM
jgi:hypothetical protein